MSEDIKMLKDISISEDMVMPKTITLSEELNQLSLQNCNQANYSTTIPRCFPKFADLPMELQLRIWSHAIPTVAEVEHENTYRFPIRFSETPYACKYPEKRQLRGMSVRSISSYPHKSNHV